MSRFAYLVVPGLCLVLLNACGRSATPTVRSVVGEGRAAAIDGVSGAPIVAPPGRPMGDPSVFLAQLRNRGVVVEQLDEAQQPFLRPIGMRLRLRGGPLAHPTEFQAYPYSDPATAAEDASRVQPDTIAVWTAQDGSTKGASFVWVAPPHFYQRETILVIYTGTDPATRALLADILGPQFVGR